MTLNGYMQPKKRHISLKAAIRIMRARWYECTYDNFIDRLARVLRCNIKEGTQITEQGEKKIVTKRKTLQPKFTKHVVEWLDAFDKETTDKEAWVFPSLRVVFYSAFFDFFSEKPMTIQNFDRILKRLDPQMTSCLFRYGGTEKYLALGYTPQELKEIGDWESSRMPEIYAERKGITPAQRRFAEDIR